MEEEFANSFWMQTVLPNAIWIIAIPVCCWKISSDIRKRSFPFPHIFAIMLYGAILFFWEMFELSGYDVRYDKDVKINTVIAGIILTCILCMGAVLSGFALRKSTIYR